jgi:hypothetical protein
MGLWYAFIIPFGANCKRDDEVLRKKRRDSVAENLLSRDGGEGS